MSEWTLTKSQRTRRRLPQGVYQSGDTGGQQEVFVEIDDRLSRQGPCERKECEHERRAELRWSVWQLVTNNAG